MKDRNLYLLHAIDCIEKIEQYTCKGKEFFLNDTKTQDAVIRNIEVIGQCIKDYGIEDLKDSLLDIPWDKMAGMRNILAHQYLGVDINLTWEVVSTHLMPLKRALTTLTPNS